MITVNIYKQSLNIVVEILYNSKKPCLLLYFIIYAFGNKGKGFDSSYEQTFWYLDYKEYKTINTHYCQKMWWHIKNSYGGNSLVFQWLDSELSLLLGQRINIPQAMQLCIEAKKKNSCGYLISYVYQLNFVEGMQISII